MIFKKELMLLQIFCYIPLVPLRPGKHRACVRMTIVL